MTPVWIATLEAEFGTFQAAIETLAKEHWQQQ
jgi:hypothetical protein